MKDFYKILGVPPSSTLPEIKRAYRRLSKRYHPDLNPGNTVFEEKFKTLQEAYSVLKDPVKRTSFDSKLEAKRRVLNTVVSSVNNINQHQRPPLRHRSIKKNDFTRRSILNRPIKKNDFYKGGGVLLLLVIVVSTIIFLESSYYHNEATFESIDTSYETPALDSAKLIRGFEADSIEPPKQNHSSSSIKKVNAILN
jgi:curved DNA-binding protein CbpA